MQWKPDKLTGWLQGFGKKPKLLMLLGIAGILLIALSSFFPESDKKQSAGNEGTFPAEAYVEQLESKLRQSIANIVGSDRVDVLITLDSGVEYIYANEVKSSNENAVGDDKTQEKDSSEKKYVIINAESGKEVPLTVTEIMPRIKGVVVVCAGGGSETVQNVVRSAVTTALDISETRVCVTGYSQN